MKNPSAVLFASLRILCALCAVSWGDGRTMADGFSVRELPTRSQLPVGNVHCILQDDLGYMWYGTHGGGLCRDNGYELDVFKFHNQGSSTDFGVYINCLEQGENHCIYIGTNCGLYGLEQRNCHIFTLLEGGYVSAMETDDKGRLWAVVDGTVWEFDTLGGDTLGTFGEFGESAAALQRDEQGDLWLMFWYGGLYKWSRAQQKFVRQPLPAGVRPMRLVSTKVDDLYWLADYGKGIWLYNAATAGVDFLEETSGKGMETEYLDVVFDGARDILWVTTLDNIYAFRPDASGTGLKRMDTGSFISGEKKVLDLMCLDKEGNLWVSGFIPTTFVVSDRYSSVVRRVFDDADMLKGFPMINDRFVDDGDVCWIGQGRVGLLAVSSDELTTNGVRRVKDSGGGLKEVVHGVDYYTVAKCVGCRGVWVAEGERLVRLHVDERGRVVRDGGVRVGEGISRIVDVDGRHVLVCHGDSLSVVDVRKGEVVRCFAASGKVVDAKTDADGEIFYVVRGEGLYGVTKDGGVVCLSEGIDEEFTAIDVAPDGVVWGCTLTGGVYSFAPEEGCGRRCAVAGDVDGCALYDIKVDRRRHVWTLCNQYAKETNPRNGSTRVIRATDADVDVYNFYKLEKNEAGDVGIGGSGAFIQTCPSDGLDVKPEVPRAPVVTGYVCGEERVFVGDTGDLSVVEMDCDLSAITVFCSTLSYLFADRISFLYVFDGNEPVYLSQGNNVIYLHNVSVGRHVLKIRATNESGVWMDVERSVVIRRLPHWWQRWWVRVLGVCFLSVVVVLLYLSGRRVRLLLSLRDMRERLSLREIDIKPVEGVVSERNEEFLSRVVKLVEDHLDDSGYNVERLCGDLCMSRANLYRRLQPLTGKSPLEFVRDIRLKAAARIIARHPQKPIGEVAECVGFSNCSYFAKCFKARFGVNPSQYKPDEGRGDL